MRPWKWALFFPVLCLTLGQLLTRAPTAEDRRTSSWATDGDLSEPIAELVEQAIRNEKIPGAVVLIGSREKVLFRGAFGNRAIEPSKRPMTVDTIFDLGSLTKVVATTTAVMQLVQNGKVRLEDPVVKYWPAFKKNGKGKITLRQLLTHYSGLREGLDLRPAWSGYRAAIEKVLAERPVEVPGTHFCYSDINFIVLGELVSGISGLWT
jgi:CubicO group peptidase (beta-lactamase class C family)